MTNPACLNFSFTTSSSIGCQKNTLKHSNTTAVDVFNLAAKKGKNFFVKYGGGVLKRVGFGFRRGGFRFKKVG